MGNITPCYKYYTYQEWWSDSDPTVCEEFMEFLTQESPLWLLTVPNEDNEELLKVIDQQYELRQENNFLRYYRLTE